MKSHAVVRPLSDSIRRRSFGLLLGLAATLFALAGASATRAACPNEALRIQQRATHLPDCRAFEMVSPVDKNGGSVNLVPGSQRAAVAGDGFAFVSKVTFGDSKGSGVISSYVARRSASEWKTRSLMAHQAPNQASALSYPITFTGSFTDDLSEAVVRLGAPQPSPGGFPETQNLYRQNIGTGAYSLLSAPTNPNPTPLGFLGDTWYSGSSADLDRVFFESLAAFTPDATQFQNNVYESKDGQLTLVSGGLGEGTPVLGSGRSATALGFKASPHAVSEDGSRIFITLTDPACFCSAGKIYLRENGAIVAQVNESQRATPEQPQPAWYSDATHNGDKVYFWSNENLLDGHTQNRSLYEYDVAAGQLALLNRDSEPTPGDSQTPNLIGRSDDGSYVYFTDGDKLLPGLPEREPAGSYLYYWHEDALNFVAAIGQSSPGVSRPTERDLTLELPGSVTTPDGRRILFQASGPLTGYDGGPTCPVSVARKNPESPCAQLYLFDAEAQQIACVSCPQNEEKAAGDAILEVPQSTGAPRREYLPRNLSDDGERVYFSTPQSLVPSDSNGLYDAYEWRGGELRLLSSGSDDRHAFFLDASATGSDVFIGTGGRLVSADRDANVDVYDVRVNGGISAQNPIPAAPCSGEGCRGTGAGAPPAPSPASSNVRAGSKSKAKGKKRCGKARKGNQRKKATRCKAGKKKAKR